MKQLLLLLTMVSATSLAQGVIPAKPLTVGEVRTLKSNILNEDRQLNVYLPNHYDASKSYAVIYLLDGSLDEDFMHVSGLVQFFDLMFKMPESIVVGISNVDRRRDFTFPTEVEDLKKAYPTTGGSAKFISFIETELQPFVASNYKTTSERFLIGQSLGGLVACEILVEKPQLFSHYFIVSPSLWWDDHSLPKQLKQKLAENDYKGRYVYMSAGAKEDEIMQRDARSFYENLSHSAKGLNVDLEILPNEDHATILHQSLYTAFARLFPKRY